MANVFSIIPDPVTFVTTTIVDWVDVFTRREYCDIIVDSLKHCSEKRGLQIYAWVLMTNHIHMIVGTDSHDILLEDVVRDFKKYTSKAIIDAIRRNSMESRKEWLLKHFVVSRFVDKPKFRFWQEGFDRFDIYSTDVLHQKAWYIHQNPVKAGVVDEPYDYRYSSAPDYAGRMPMLVPLCLIPPRFKTY